MITTPAVGFVQRLGRQLLLNGLPYKVAGGNTYYLGYLPEPTLDAALDRAQSFGMNAIRAWAFLDSELPPGPWDVAYQYWDAATGTPVLYEGPNGLDRLDRAVAKAGERGMRLILTLTNNWADFGGMPRYCEWFGIDPKQHKNYFYTDERCKAAYRNYVQQIVTRRNTLTGRLYRDEPAILAWELANEPRCENHGGVDTLLGWVHEMADFVKSLDANHLVAVGDEGYFLHHLAWFQPLYNGSFGVSCEELLGIGSVDLGTCHLYPEVMAKSEHPKDFGLRWIREHIAAAGRADKPMLIEEYGSRTLDRRNEIFDAWLREIEALDGMGDMLWMMGLPKSDQQWYAPDEYVLMSPDDAPAVREHTARVLGATLTRTAALP